MKVLFIVNLVNWVNKVIYLAYQFCSGNCFVTIVTVNLVGTISRLTEVNSD